MKYFNLKPIQKLLTPSKNDFTVHKDARTALSVWQRYKPIRADIDLSQLNKFYRPPLRLVAGNNGAFCFINDFNRIHQILLYEKELYHPCLITPEYGQDITRLAWREVLQLCFLQDIYHPAIYNALKELAPKRVIYDLIGISDLSIKAYCQFVGINQYQYEYRQSRTANDEGSLGLPANMMWLSEDK